ncbi:MAG TPA: aspartate kinase [Flavobacteriales bacterium]|nr:aspartate kinase [Flavobacteriales bacterium]HIO68731.1 aspartate kinase [Flavobacteriales bacterium]
MRVFKFGGASVKDAEAVRNVGKVMGLYPNEEIVVVVSAMGKTTNALEKITKEYMTKEGDLKKSIQELKDYHNDILADLFPDQGHKIYNEVNNVLVELEWIIEDEPIDDFDFEYDQIVSLGEMISTRIVSAWLMESGIENTWVDVRDLIKTDNTYREAVVEWESTESAIKKKLSPVMKGEGSSVVVTQGFVGVTTENYNTTLGREGSDYTASILGSVLGAEDVTIWKDVPGVLNADPKWFEKTKKLEAMSYHDAIELAFFGATVIHPKTLKPLQNNAIPLYVKSFFDPEKEGTLITGVKKLPKELELVPSFIFKVNQVLISILPRDYSFIVEENLSEIFKLFADIGVKINLMQHAALSFSVCVDEDGGKIPDLVEALQKDYKVLYNEDVELVTIRDYDQATIDRVISGKKIYVEQKSRQTARFVVKDVG